MHCSSYKSESYCKCFITVLIRICRQIRHIVAYIKFKQIDDQKYAKNSPGKFTEEQADDLKGNTELKMKTGRNMADLMRQYSRKLTNT